MPSCTGSYVVWAATSTEPDVSLSITALGGMRPPTPMTTGTMSVLVKRPEATVTVGRAISVIVRLHATELAGQSVAPNDEPGRNSSTAPDTFTCCPTETVGVADVNTKMPSEVATSPSPSPSCMKNPLPTTCVTMPGTLVTHCPLKGETWPRP